ncbi:MAG: STAS domain-containing protein [Anaerolineae bacterium]|jgi:anti-sigma B factor antagonist
MEIKTEVMNRCVLVSLSGRVDNYHAPELEAALLDLIQSGKKNLAINMKGVELISSGGLRALVTAEIKARRAVPGGELVLSELPPLIQESMELVGFHHLFQIFDSDVEAVGSF